MLRRFLTLAVFICLLSFAALAQRDLATMVGVVTDATGAVVPGARVTITEDATSLKYAVEADPNGNFIRPLLKPGTYTVEVEATGFKKGIQRNILLTAGDRVAVNLTLTVGEVTQVVEITAAAPLLQTESTIIGENLGSRQVSELPLGGQRKFTFLARLSPGVLPPEVGARDEAGGGFSANGVRSNGQNNFLLNGVDNNVNVIDFINQTSYVIGPSVEAIGEMRVLTNGYNAEYGRGAGGVVNVTIKSGTNQLHGALFEFLQNDKLNANKWESNRAGVDRGAFKQNQFGAAAGGPIKRDRTFVFADYQGTRIRSTGGTVPGLGFTETMTIPRPEFKNGDFSSILGNVIGSDPLGNPVREGQIYDFLTTRANPNGSGFVRDPFPNNQIPVNRFDAVAKKLLDQFPAPNQNLNTRLPAGNYFAVTSGQQQNDQADIRVDHRLTEKDSLFGSLSWSEESKFNSTPLPPDLDHGGFGGQTELNQGRNAMISHTRVWTPRIISETRVAFSRLITARTQANATEDLFTKYGIGGYNPSGAALNGGLPLLTMDDYLGWNGIGASDWLPTKEYNNVWDFIENVAINRGSHALKFGGEFRPIKFPFFQVPSPHGDMFFGRNRTNNPQDEFANATGDGMASFLLGYPTSGQISTNNFISSEKSAWAFYAQDDWKVTSKLTLNIGLRYELFSPIGERFGRQSNFDFPSQTLFIPKGRNQDAPLPPNFATAFPTVTVSRGQVDKYLIPWDKTDFSPRFGFAYQLRTRLVVRGGYGIFYGGEENQGGYPNRGEAVPFNETVILNGPTFFKNPYFNRLSDGFPVDVFDLPAPVQFRGLAKNFRNPLVHKWNFAIQHELPFNTALEISYLGNHQSHQVTFWDPNIYPRSPNVDVSSVPNSDSLRPVPSLGDVGATTYSFGYGNYHALGVKLEKRYSQGLDFLTAYTWAHALSNTGTTLSGGTGGWGLTDPRNFATLYSSALWDRRHSFTTSFVYDLPLGRGRRYGANWSPALNAIAGGWQVNGILSYRTGPPVSLGTRFGIGFVGVFHPDVVAGKDPKNAPSGGRSPERWFDTSAVAAPQPYTNGTLGNQAVNGPGTRNIDLSLFKDFRLTERYKIQFRAESFNLSNTPQFDSFNMGITQGNDDFGQIHGTLPGTERHTQFALRLMF
jgi:hypothetical protein